MAEFDTETLIGKPAQLVVVHEHKEGQVYANIAACTADRSGEPLKPSGKFTRAKDRVKDGQQNGSGGQGGYRRAQLHHLLVLGRMPAIDGRLIGRELDYRVARAARAFDALEAACAHQEFRAVFAERRGVGGDVGLVLLRVGDIDSDDPVSLRHGFLQ